MQGTLAWRAPGLGDWSEIVSWWSWIVVALGLIAAVVAVQFDEPWLEISGAATFVLLFAWVVVALRVRTGAMKSELPRGHSSTSRDPTRPRHES